MFYLLIVYLRFKTEERRIIKISIIVKKSRFLGDFSFLNRAQLMKVRQKAMRAGVWFTGLRRIDRVLVDLTIQVIDNIRSASLAKSILEITKKLESVMESKFSRAMREFGVPLAKKLSQFALGWGYETARAWASDTGFVRYLAVMQLNGAFR